MQKIQNIIAVSIIAMVMLLFSDSSAQNDTSQVVIGKILNLQSTVLGENRKIRLYTPENYNSSNSAYPVFYLLDGERHFFHVSSIASFLSSVGKMPNMIIVAIENTDRIRDLSPTHTIIGYNEIDSIFLASSGGSEKFFRFLSEELIPFVDGNYRTQPFRALCGQSLGGLFTIYTLLEHPQFFNAYIAISPALWWDDKAILKKVSNISKISLTRPSFLFISVANEGGLFEQSVLSFENSLKEYAPTKLEWIAQSYPNEGHKSSPLIGAYDGLSFIYSGWLLFTDGAKDSAYISYEQFLKHYQVLTQKYGYPIKASEMDIYLFGDRLLKQKKIDEAIDVYEHAVKEYPNSSDIFEGLAKSYMNKGNNEPAIKNYKRALELNPNNANAKYMFESLVK
jgi:predicted alpha/beta superfamily hydrolase